MGEVDPVEHPKISASMTSIETASPARLNILLGILGISSLVTNRNIFTCANRLKSNSV